MTQADALLALICGKMAAKFYGEVLVKFEAGRIVIVKTTESVKLTEEDRGVGEPNGA